MQTHGFSPSAAGLSNVGHGLEQGERDAKGEERQGAGGLHRGGGGGCPKVKTLPFAR
jgi:hypothetical protein